MTRWFIVTGVTPKSGGYIPISVYDGKAALENATSDISLFVLDIMMPQLSGIDVCKEIRKTSQVPIIMLTAKGEEIDRIIGLELGADDYIVKPFSPREVVARIKTVLRRSVEHEVASSRTVSIGGLQIDISRYSVTLFGKPIICTQRAEILHMLASNRVRFSRASSCCAFGAMSLQVKQGL